MNRYRCSAVGRSAVGRFEFSGGYRRVQFAMPGGPAAWRIMLAMTEPFTFDSSTTFASVGSITRRLSCGSVELAPFTPTNSPIRAVIFASAGADVNLGAAGGGVYEPIERAAAIWRLEGWSVPTATKT